MDEEVSLRVGDAADLLGIDAKEVYRAVERGELAASHLADHGIRLRRSDVEPFREVRQLSP
jgi:excisionase family DNA binding protein